MTPSQVGKQVRSFVSFALAMKPLVTIQRRCPGDTLSDTAVTFKIDDTTKLSEQKVSSLETLIRKYEPIKHFLTVSSTPEEAAGLNVLTCSPKVDFQPDVDYRLIKLNEEQIEVAKEVARLVERTHGLHTSGDNSGAKTAYKDLETYLAKKRADLIGDFKDVGQITQAVGMHGLGQAGNPRADGDCGGAVIFVIIEIFVM